MRKTRHKITFLDPADQKAGAMCLLGQWNSSINQKVSLRGAQIQYRSSKLAKLYGIKGGLRRAWARGQSPWYREFAADMLSVAMADIEHNIAPKLLHVPAKVSRHKPRRAPTVDEAVVLLKRNKVALP